MTDEGVFCVHRGAFKHPFFADEPYSEREAWFWLLGNAAWQQTTVRVKRERVTIQRGQLCFAERFLAEKWKWSKSRVHRFLIRLKIESMVNLSSDHETNLITICNYDEYQFSRTGDGPEVEPQSGPVADQSRTKEETFKKEIDIVRSTSAPAELFELPAKPKRANGADPYFSEFYSAYPRRQSKQDALKAYSQVRKSGTSHESIMSGLERAKRSDQRFREMRFTPLPASWLRAGGFEDDTAPPQDDWKKAAYI